MFKVKNKESKRLVVQFGKSMEDWMDCNMAIATDMNDSGSTRRIVFADLKDKKVEDDLESLHKNRQAPVRGRRRTGTAACRTTWSWTSS